MADAKVVTKDSKDLKMAARKDSKGLRMVALKAVETVASMVGQTVA